MQIGFSYNGVHCSELGCFYAPAPEEMFTFPDVTVSSSDVAGRNGSYFHSSKYNARVFKLRCYFEDLTVDRVYKIAAWLSKNTAGKQVFDDRPTVYYEVRPTSKFEPTTYACRHDWINQVVYSGTFTAEFTAFFPFGHMERKSYSGLEECNEVNFSGILPSSMTPTAPSSISASSIARSFLVYNCGSQPCDTIISLKGQAPSTGLLIRNLSNGTKCRMNELSTSAVVKVDGTLGKTSAVASGKETEDNSLHDEGYIVQEPYTVLYKDVAATTTSGSNRIKVAGINGTSALVGLHIYLGGTWRKITDVLSSGELVVSSSPTSTKTEYTMITKMNELEISASGVFSLSELSIDFTPLVL